MEKMLFDPKIKVNNMVIIILIIQKQLNVELTNLIWVSNIVFIIAGISYGVKDRYHHFKNMILHY